jgi:hypothetical protein
MVSSSGANCQTREGADLADINKILAFIANCKDRKQLENILANARRENEPEVERAAFRRLVAIGSQYEPGSLEHDLWQTIFAFERVLADERGKTVRLSRTRQKLGRVGVVQTLTDWAEDPKETDGFRMLLDRGMLDLVGEAIVLRHPHRFHRSIVDSARARLEKYSNDPSLLWPCGAVFRCAGEAGS